MLSGNRLSLILIYLLILILISNAVATNQNKSVLYSRFTILGLLSISIIVYMSLYIKPLENGIGLYNGLFNISILSQSFNWFIVILTSIISILTAFYSKKMYEGKVSSNLYKVKSDYNITNNLNNNYLTLFLNKNDFQFTIIEYSLITIFVISGAIFLISVGDLVSLFLSIELQSYGLYIIATIYRNSESATGSGLTYFLLGGLSSCFILLGSAILYVNSGLTNLDNIYILNSFNEFKIFENEFNMLSLFSETKYEAHNVDKTPNYLNFSLIILTVGLLFKISAAPFHFWSPDVYDGIPTIVTTFVATIAKISLLILMVQLVLYCDITNDNFYDTITFFNYDWTNILILSSLMSLIIGSLLGLTQHRIKRLFAYSTISHVGFILLALSINKIESLQGFIFYILQYSICNLNSFFILITIGYTLYEYAYKSNSSQNIGLMLQNPGVNKLGDKTTDIKNLSQQSIVEKLSVNESKDKYIDIDNSPIQLLSQIKGYFYINSFLSISFAITLFSFVGIPPLIGFFAKQMVLSAALDQGYVFITLIAIITSVIGAAYYLNIVKLIFFSQSDYVKHNVISAALHDTDSDKLRSEDYENSNKNVMCINDKLSITVSVLTMFILFFIFMPDEWFRIVNILSLSVNKY